MSIKPNICVLTAPGINCNEETAFAFEMAGANAEQVHISQIRSGERPLDEFQGLAISGGFSYGDDIRAGKILGLELKATQAEELNKFAEAGKAILGICNGFQVLVESGLLPSGRIEPDQLKSVSLIGNQSGKFECRWVPLQVGASVCKYLGRAEAGNVIELPVAHAEGRFIAPQAPIPSDKITFSYSSLDGDKPVYPDNPNGSAEDIAGICDPSGIVLGMMPHPERFVSRTQHPNWRRGEGSRPYGALIFKGMVDYLKEM